MEQYFDPKIGNEEIHRIAPGAMESSRGFDAETTRKRPQRRGLLPDNFVRYCYRPFDLRWLYWEPETKLLERSRPEYVPHVIEGNIWIEARQRHPQEQFDRGYVVRHLADNFGNGLSNYFPLYLHVPTVRDSLFEEDAEGTKPNLSPEAAAYLKDLDASAEKLFYHVVALLHSPAYRKEHAGALRLD
jgi:predicted helicase